MSLIPEYILQQVLVRGLEQFRITPNLVDMLFRNLRQEDLKPIRDFFINKSKIDLCINFPDEGLKLPSIVMLLKQESESQAFLGDLMQSMDDIYLTGHPFAKDMTSALSTEGAGTAGPLNAQQKIYLQESQATGGGIRSIRVAQATLPLIDPFDDGFVIITAGTGAGQKRAITGITPIVDQDSVITIGADWNTIPDTTSVFKIVGEPYTVGFTGEPSKVFTPGQMIERRGQHYKAIYQLFIVAYPQELTIYLYAVAKAIITMNRPFLIKNGFMNVKMSGSDLMIRQEYLPQQSFQRILTLEFDYAFDVYQAISGLPSHIVTSLTTEDHDVEGVVMETSIDLP